MATIINADTVTGGAIITGDNSGVLQLKTGGVTAMTIGTDQSVTFAGTVVGAGGTVSATASGSLANGDKVIVNSDGTVSAVVGSSEVTFTTNSVSYTASAYDSINQRIVIAYLDGSNSDKGTAVVGTISGRNITFGTPVVFNNAGTWDIGAAFNVGTGKIVITYRNVGNSSYGTAIVGTVSGSTISFGTPVVYASAASYNNKIVNDPVNNKVGIFYTASSIGAGVGWGIIGTVSGTSISFGSAASMNSGSNVGYLSAAYDVSQSCFVIGFSDTNVSSGKASAFTGTVSGTSISYGTKASWDALYVSATSLVYDSTNQKIVMFAYESSSTSLRSMVGAVSGTTITFDSQFTGVANSTNNITSVYDPAISKVIVSYNRSNVGYFTVGTVSGTSISYGAETIFNNSSTSWVSSVYDSTNQVCVNSYNDSPASGKSIVIGGGGTTNLTSSNFIGISSAAYTNGQTAVIQTVGSVDDAQSGLTAGRLYYVTPTGTLSTTAGSPSVIAGTAVSATKLIIKG